MSALSFFQPAFLWALGFLAVVLALHFFRRRVVRKMSISTLRFFPSAAVSQSRVKKLVDLLLLIARLILIAALIFIFAGLHDRSSPLVALSDPHSIVYTWVDPTVSMEYADGGASSGQRAVAVVDTLAAVLPQSVEHYRFDHESGRFVLSGAPAGREARGNFAGRYGPVNLEEAVDAFIAASSSTPSAVFIVLTDFQKSTLEAFDSLSSRLAGNDKKVICVSVAPSKPHNYSVTARGNAAVVRAHGAALDTTFVELTVGDLRVGQRSVSCAAGDSAVVSFDMPQSLAGSWGRAALNVSDPLPFDNADLFTVSADKSRSALIVGDVRRNRVIGAALRASGPAFWDPVVYRDGGDLSYEDLNAADLVIVNNFNGRSRVLESFISGAGAGKGIIITLDPDREDDFGRTYLRGSGLSRAALSANTVEAGAHPVLSDTNTALWRGFPAASSRNARVYRHTGPVPGDVLARMGNARPLASFVNQSGAGLVIISTPIGVSSANNLCETGFFVPFLDRLARHALAGRGQEDEAWYAGYVARNPFFGVGRSGTLYDRDGKLVASWASQPFVRVDRPGAYSLVSSAGETTRFAVSAHPSEGEMIFGRPDVHDAGGIYYFESVEFLEQIGDLSNNIWSHWLWVILGLMLCLEVFLWRRQSVKK
ncbi:MAG: BatA domain-containing protein [Chitinispirillia bacterium]|nr:BatA domain-containing protein [Chitinispirillia bacterium]MCL2269568.1 BatA domain-containing protein [Chitinispirillia bacterium]